MPANSLRVTLLAPGCFSLVSPSAGETGVPAVTESTPDINDAKAFSTGTLALEQAVAAALQQTIPDMGDLPAALHRFPQDFDEGLPEHCVCAEFVHLLADRDNARLIPEIALNISKTEVEALLDAVNRLVSTDGIELRQGSDGRNYLTGMPSTALDTWPAHAVANGKIAHYMPRQTDAGDWRRLITEVQMLYHSHPINVRRADRGQLPINGLWFWGGNQITEYSPVNNFLMVATDAYAAGLADAVGAKTIQSALRSWSELKQHEQFAQQKRQVQGSAEHIVEQVVIVDQHAYQCWLRGDYAALSEAKQQLHKQWIEPLQQAVTIGEVSEFILDGCEGQAIVERQANKPGFIKRLLPKRFLRTGD